MEQRDATRKKAREKDRGSMTVRNRRRDKKDGLSSQLSLKSGEIEKLIESILR